MARTRTLDIGTTLSNTGSAVLNVVDTTANALSTGADTLNAYLDGWAAEAETTRELAKKNAELRLQRGTINSQIKHEEKLMNIAARAQELRDLTDDNLLNAAKLLAEGKSLWELPKTPAPEA